MRPHSRIRRNLLVVVALFGLTGLLIMFASTFQAPSIPPEPAEITQLRSSPTQNALPDVVNIAASMPLAGPRIKTLENDPGPAAQLLRVAAKDDDPAIDEYLETIRPSLLQIAQLLNDRPYFLMPAEWHVQPANTVYEQICAFPFLQNAMFVVGIRDAISGRDPDQALLLVLASYRLHWNCIAEFGWQTHWAESAAPELAQNVPPEFRVRLLKSLLDLKTQWRQSPPHFEDRVRAFQRALQDRSHRYSSGFGQVSYTVRERLRSYPARRLIIANKDRLAQVSTRGVRDYRDWEKTNMNLAEACDFPLFSFSLRSICRANSTYQFSLDSVILVLAVEQYHQDHGNYPDSLEGLVPDYLPEIPIDSFSNQPYRYKNEGADYRLYSLGNSGRDDGGTRYHSGNMAIHLPPEK